MKLEPLTLERCEQVRLWRNQEMECWRTPFMLTKEMQEDFYRRCCDRNSPHRYWAIMLEEDEEKCSEAVKKDRWCWPFLGMGGITYIQWENRIGEITLIIDPERRGDGIGEQAVDLLLDQAFNSLNLETVFGECYKCNIYWEFWKNVTEKYAETTLTMYTDLPNRKYCNGKYWDSFYFSIDKDDFNKIHSGQQSQSES